MSDDISTKTPRQSDEINKDYTNTCTRLGEVVKKIQLLTKEQDLWLQRIDNLSNEMTALMSATAAEAPVTAAPQ